jgi:hypothetical protein
MIKHLPKKYSKSVLDFQLLISMGNFLPKWHKFGQSRANPTIKSYNASVVEIYNAANSIARFYNEIIVFLL